MNPKVFFKKIEILKTPAPEKISTKSYAWVDIPADVIKNSVLTHTPLMDVIHAYAREQLPQRVFRVPLRLRGAGTAMPIAVPAAVRTGPIPTNGGLTHIVRFGVEYEYEE